jgi:hypothetical protein
MLVQEPSTEVRGPKSTFRVFSLGSWLSALALRRSKPDRIIGLLNENGTEPDAPVDRERMTTPWTTGPRDVGIEVDRTDRGGDDVVSFARIQTVPA